MYSSKKQNTETFRTPFSIRFWRYAAAELKDPKMLVLAALFVALRIAVKSIKIPVTDTVSVFFTFVVNALGSYIYGPVVGFVSGAVCDTVTYLLKPSGPYNPAFMIVEGLGSFLFGVCLYRARVSVLRLFLSKLSVSLICNILLTPIFLATMYGNGKTVFAYMSVRIPKNLMLLPIETAMLFVVFSVMLPVLKRTRVIPWLTDNSLSIL